MNKICISYSGICILCCRFSIFGKAYVEPETCQIFVSNSFCWDTKKVSLIEVRDGLYLEHFSIYLFWSSLTPAIYF